MNAIQDTKKRFTHWEAFLVEDKRDKLIAAFEEAPAADIAEFLEQQTLPVAVHYFLLLSQEMQASLFPHFRKEKQLEIYHKLPVSIFARIFEEIFSDVRADFYLALDEKAKARLLPYLSKQVRKDVLLLSGYPPEKAGGIMTTEFVKVTNTTTAEEALAAVRGDVSSRKMLYYLYIVNEKMQLVNVIDLKELIIAEPKDQIASFAEKKDLVFVRLGDDQEQVAQQIAKYNLMAVPVLNNHDQIVGIVSYDDAIDIIRAEETEDMEKFMGIIPDEKEQPYLHTPTNCHVRQRLPWLVFLLILTTAGALIVHHYEKVLGNVTFLIVYLAMISDTGGNVGSQSATVVIRALSLGELSLKDWRRIVYKELKIALSVGGVLFLVSLLKLLIFLGFIFNKRFTEMGYSLWSSIGGISTALFLQVITSALIGTCLPLLIKKLGKDPALAASPAITTLVDIIGSLIYLSLMCWLLGLKTA
ncbi:MAG: magnesium transporter [Bacteroidota bacterium]